MRARFYIPEIKRFINQDILLGGIGEGQTLNRYAFVTGQPVSFVDPFGFKKSGNCGTNSYECMIYGLDDPSMREFGEQLLDIIPGDLIETIWVCNRPINELYGQILPNHKYVCCDGENQNCYGHRLNDLMPGDEIPPEGNPSGQCELRKVTPQNRKAHCETLKSPCKANTITWNCRAWAEWDGVSECPPWTKW